MPGAHRLRSDGSTELLRFAVPAQRDQLGLAGTHLIGPVAALVPDEPDEVPRQADGTEVGEWVVPLARSS
jgi:hypothetical protein